MIANPFGVEVGKTYKYRRPGWVYASIVLIEENAHDPYGMQVRDSEYRGDFKIIPAKLFDFPADGIFELLE